MTGDRVLCRPLWWSRQWVTGKVLAERDSKLLVEYGVDTDLFGSYRQAKWVPRRRVAT